jgi:hypothetical protein
LLTGAEERDRDQNGSQRLPHANTPRSKAGLLKRRVNPKPDAMSFGARYLDRSGPRRLSGVIRESAAGEPYGSSGGRPS